MTKISNTVNQLNGSGNVSTTPFTRSVTAAPVFQNVPMTLISQSVSTASVFRNVSTPPSFRNVSMAQGFHNQPQARVSKNVSMITNSPYVSMTMQDSAKNTSTTQVFPNLSPLPVSGNAPTPQVSGTISTESFDGSSTSTANKTNSSDAPDLAPNRPSWLVSTDSTVSNTTNKDGVVDNQEEIENTDRKPDCREECHHVNGTHRCTQGCSETNRYNLCTIVSIGLFLIGMVIGALVIAITVHCCCSANRNKQTDRHEAVNETFDKHRDPYNLKKEYITKEGIVGHGFSSSRAKKLRQISPISSIASLIYPWSDSDQDSPRVSPRVRSVVPDYDTDGFSGNDFMEPELTNGTPDVNKRNNHARVSLID